MRSRGIARRSVGDEMSVDQDEHPLSSLMADLRMAAPNDEDASREKSLVGALFDASHDCLKILTPDGRLMAMNKACLLGMEIDDAEAVNGSEWTSLWPQEHRSLVETYLHRAAAGQAGGIHGLLPDAERRAALVGRRDRADLRSRWTRRRHPRRVARHYAMGREPPEYA